MVTAIYWEDKFWASEYRDYVIWRNRMGARGRF